jgi:hypothetical protein
MSRRGCSLPANASGFDPHRASLTGRFGQVNDDYDVLAPVAIPLIVIFCICTVCSRVYQIKKSNRIDAEEKMFHVEAKKKVGKMWQGASQSEGGFVPDQLHSGLNKGIDATSRAVDGVMDASVAAMDVGLKGARMVGNAGSAVMKGSMKVGSSMLDGMFAVANRSAPVVNKATKGVTDGAKKGGRFFSRKVKEFPTGTSKALKASGIFSRSKKKKKAAAEAAAAEAARAGGSFCPDFDDWQRRTDANGEFYWYPLRNTIIRTGILN